MKIMLVHIPRTAGTFLSTSLAQIVGFERTFSVDLQEITLEHFLEHKENIIDRYDFITGHFPFRFVEEFSGKFDLILACVRSPLQRLLSAFYYERERAKTATSTEAIVDQLRHFFAVRFKMQVGTRNEQCSYLGRVNRFASVVSTLSRHPNLRLLRHHQLKQDLASVFETYGLAIPDVPLVNAGGGDRLEAMLEINPELLLEILEWFDDDYLLLDYLIEARPLAEPM